MTVDDTNDEWSAWWDGRIAAMEQLLGPMHDLVGHATIPFDVGPDLGGAADIIYFRTAVPGVVSVTAELIGRDDQMLNSLGTYELAICHRNADPWGANLISRLAYYTLRAQLNPGDTMDIGSVCPEGSSIEALLFQEFGRFTVRGRDAGLLLCIGITGDELALCRQGQRKREQVESALKAQGVFPFTDLNRDSVVWHIPRSVEAGPRGP
jgi:hypothetical protein